MPDKPLYKEGIQANAAHCKENNPLWLFLSFVQTSGSTTKKKEQLFSSEGPGKKKNEREERFHFTYSSPGRRPCVGSSITICNPKTIADISTGAAHFPSKLFTQADTRN
jgi:hypothetical protein